MPFTISSTAIENDEVELTTDANGALSILHKPSGQTVGLDPDGTFNSPTVNTGEIDIEGATYATGLPHNANEDWFRVGTVTDLNTSVHCLVTESSRTGGDGEPGYEIVHYRIGNADTAFSGTHVEFADPADQIRESAAKIVHDATAGEWHLYYKVAPYQTADIHVYPDSFSKSVFEFEWVNVGGTEPTGDTNYTLDRHFNVIADVVQTDGDIEAGGAVRSSTVDTDTAGINQTQVSGRVGGYVYYDSSNPGPYASIQEAAAAVPSGGTLFLASGTIDITSEGTLSLSRPITIRGCGTTDDTVGTVLDNVGSGSIDSPVIEFSDTARMQRPIIRDLAIRHQGGTTPAVRINNATRSTIDNCWINCTSTAPTGISYEGESWFSRCLRSRITAFSDTGVIVRGLGYAHEFYSNHIASGIDGAVGLETWRHRTLIQGGEVACTGVGGTAIRFFNPETDQTGHRYGGLVVNPGIENTEYPIEVNDGGSGFFIGVEAHHIFTMSAAVDVITFGKSRASRLVRPVRMGSNTNIANWTADSLEDGVVTSHRGVRNVGVNVSTSAIRPFIKLEGSVNNVELATVPTDASLDIHCDYNPDQNSPVFHDGTDWYEQSSANTAFTP